MGMSLSSSASGKGKNTGPLLKIADCMQRDGTFFGGSMTFRNTQADDAEILTYGQALEQVKHLTLDQWREARGNASRAAKLKKETALQKAINCMHGVLGEFIVERAKADAIVFKVCTAESDLQVAGYPEGISDEMQNCKGWSWDPVFKRFVFHTFGEYMDTELHLLKSAFLVGEGGGGKSTLMRQCARRFGLMYEKELYVLTKQLDPAGLLTKSGMLLEAAAFCVTDFDPVSQNGVALTEEGLKGLIDVEEGGGYPARHHVAMIRAGIPRLFAVNGSGAELTEWFAKYTCTAPLAPLLIKDAEVMRIAHPDVQAQARRIVVFPCPRKILLASGKEKLQEQSRSKVAAGLARLKDVLGK